jgi:hypothetical protein
MGFESRCLSYHRVVLNMGNSLSKESQWKPDGANAFPFTTLLTIAGLFAMISSINLYH